MPVSSVGRYIASELSLCLPADLRGAPQHDTVQQSASQLLAHLPLLDAAASMRSVWLSLLPEKLAYRTLRDRCGICRL